MPFVSQFLFLDPTSPRYVEEARACKLDGHLTSMLERAFISLHVSLSKPLISAFSRIMPPTGRTPVVHGPSVSSFISCSGVVNPNLKLRLSYSSCESSLITRSWLEARTDATWHFLPWVFLPEQLTPPLGFLLMAFRDNILSTILSWIDCMVPY